VPHILRPFSKALKKILTKDILTELINSNGITQRYGNCG